MTNSHFEPDANPLALALMFAGFIADVFRGVLDEVDDAWTWR